MTGPAVPRSDPAGFSADWLQQREPFDTVARDRAAGRLGLMTQLAALRPPAGSPWRVIDLGCGSGANLRWLAPRLDGPQQWLVVDHDPALLQCWPARLGLASPAAGAPARNDGDYPPLRWHDPGHDAAIQRSRLDLATQLDALPWQAARLITASALLDLVSADWLRQLVARAVAARAALLFALSVDGRHDWLPADPTDRAVAALFAAHQRRDKGFGPALGPQAGRLLRRALQAEGYHVRQARSDWELQAGGADAAQAMQLALIDGMARAACEQDPGAGAMVQAWRRRRSALAGAIEVASRLRVGHVDLLAVPPPASRA